LMVHVLHSLIPLGAVRIAFKRWNRANWASVVSFDYQLRVGLVGILAHLWLTSTMQEVLGSSCVVRSIAQESESKANLKQFFVLVDCLLPDLVPMEKSMVAPTPLSTLGKPHGLRYWVVVNILDVVVVPADEAPSGPTGAPTSSGQGPFDRGGQAVVPVARHLGLGRALAGPLHRVTRRPALGQPARRCLGVPSRLARQAASAWPPSGRRCLPALGSLVSPPPATPCPASFLTSGLQGIHAPARLPVRQAAVWH
jgi:hypothetical protein